MRISGLSQIGPEIPLSTSKGWHKSSSLSREVDDYGQHFGNSTKFCARVFSTPGCFRVHRIVCKHSLSTFLQNKTIKAGESIEEAVHCPNPTKSDENVQCNGKSRSDGCESESFINLSMNWEL